jgi:hypothetical protein
MNNDFEFWAYVITLKLVLLACFFMYAYMVTM